MTRVVDLRDAATVAGAGGKAVGLARLIGAGLPVPDGFVLTHAAFAEVVGPLPGFEPHELAAVSERIETAALPEDLAAEVEARARALGGSLAVRSSVSIEDAATGAAAGVLSSATAVDVADVWAAIRMVWASACTPLVAVYARHVAAPKIEIGVIVQRHVAGRRITVYTRPPGEPATGTIWIETDGVTTRVPRDSTEPIARLALAAEHAIRAEDSGADVEFVEEHQLFVVQARPIVHRPRRRRVPPPPALLAPLQADPTLRWHWDVEHNPEPLSPAQAGLVARVDAAGIAPYRMCTIAGYLFVAVLPDAPRAHAPETAEELWDRYCALEARMVSTFLHADDRSVDNAIASYLRFYEVWAREVAPLISAAKARVRGQPVGTIRATTIIGEAISAVARGEISRDQALELVGDFALAWDVAAPTFREQPHLFDLAIDAARGAPPQPPVGREDFAHTAFKIGELDDPWFARAQAIVRRALLAAAPRLGLVDPDDVFWLPLDDVAADEPLDPIQASVRASAARRAHDRARDWDMAAPSTSPTPTGDRWLGAGAGGPVVGRVRRLDEPTVVPPGSIVVARTITPMLAILVRGAAALVAETGGLLSHGVAIARELGIPFVVGCGGAWADLVDGDRVEVDGEQGFVRRIEDVESRT